MEAFVVCTERLTAEFSEARQMSDADWEDSMGEDMSEVFSVDQSGQFRIQMPRKGDQPGDAPLWSCVGNTKSRQITQIEFEGQAKRPMTGQVWSY